MVAGGPDVAPTGIFQFPDQIANPDRHEFMVRRSSLGWEKPFPLWRRGLQPVTI
jgi:hypothetical protein